MLNVSNNKGLEIFKVELFKVGSGSEADLAMVGDSKRVSFMGSDQEWVIVSGRSKTRSGYPMFRLKPIKQDGKMDYEHKGISVFIKRKLWNDELNNWIRAEVEVKDLVVYP